MRRALQLAERGWGYTAPNPMVGAVLVRGGETVGEGWHAHFGGAHAEVNALMAAGDGARGAELYVTLEPCAHHGKTPPCAPALVAAGITRVVIAALDPTAAGGGAALLREAGVDLRTGCEEDAARELNAPFHFAARSDRPWVTLKLAVSADGAIAAPAQPDGTRPRVWLTGGEAAGEVHRLRAGVDAIAVGVGTVTADDPRLTVRHAPAPRFPPARIVFDRLARTPLDSYIVRTAGEIPAMVVTSDAGSTAAAALRARGVEIIPAPDLHGALRLLRTRGIRSLLVEGGAALAGSFFDEDLVDRFVEIRAPAVLGDGALHALAFVASRNSILSRLQSLKTLALGDDLMTVHKVTGHDV